MEYRQRLLIYNASRQIIAQYHSVYFDLHAHVTFHLIRCKQNMKAVRSICYKIFKNLTSISKNRILPQLRPKEGVACRAMEIFSCECTVYWLTKSPAILNFSGSGRLGRERNFYRGGAGLNNVRACARSHGQRWRQRPGHHNKPRKNSCPRIEQLPRQIASGDLGVLSSSYSLKVAQSSFQYFPRSRF